VGREPDHLWHTSSGTMPRREMIHRRGLSKREGIRDGLGFLLLQLDTLGGLQLITFPRPGLEGTVCMKQGFDVVFLSLRDTGIRHRL
jgi:hypothetical protein